MIEINDSRMASLMLDMRETAQTEILPRFGAIAADAIRTKTAPDDLVTDADIGAERMLGERLDHLFPGIVIVGEEAVSDDRDILDKIGSTNLVAIIDPVDGTWNFAHGVPLFGSILAIVSKGQTVAGLIHYPVTGDFIVARRGQGAWHIARDGAQTRLAVAPPTPIEDMHGFVPLHMYSTQFQTELAPRVLRFSRTTTWRCSAFEYRMLATGAMSFCINAGLSPWDHAAGVLIHAEAGGYAALLSGERYVPTMTEGKLLLAPDELCWRAIRSALLA
tara:strand:+ start:2273 stop:3100 length:828 start_codon:yes stop_codon:yes gene_type:complete